MVENINEYHLKLVSLSQRMYPILNSDKGCNRVLTKKHALRTIQVKKWFDQLQLEEDKKQYIRSIESSLILIVNVE
jgi:hypothetical protein